MLFFRDKVLVSSFIQHIRLGIVLRVGAFACCHLASTASLLREDHGAFYSTMKPVQFSLPFLLCAFAEATLLSRQGSYETDVHLAVHPHCGPLWGKVSDVNAGLDLTRINTIVSFGVGAPLFLYAMHSPAV